MKSIKFLKINIALFILAIGDVFFLIPTKIMPGGLFGLAFNIFHILNINARCASYVGYVVFLINIPLLIYSYIKFERSYFNKSLYCTLALPLFEVLSDKIYSIYNVNFGLDASLVIGTLIQGIFVAYIMHLGSSTGGLDIISKIINHHFKKISIGTAYNFVSILIILSSIKTLSFNRIVLSAISIFSTGYLIDICSNFFKKGLKNEI